MKLRKLKILVVDDDREFRRLLVSTLSNEGMIVSEANCGLDAIKSLSKNAVDLVLSDVQMPRGNGYELLAEIKKISPTLPVILMTGSLAIITPEKTVGAIAVLEKPLDLRSLAETVLGICREIAG